MYLKTLPSDFSPEQYNKAAHHPLQTWEWGEARKQMGIEIVRTGEFADEEYTKLINVYQLSLHPLPFFPYRIGYLPRSVWPTKQALAYLSDVGKHYNVLFIKIEPNTRVNNASNLAKTAQLIPSAHPLFPEWTMVLDLKQSEETLFAQLKSKTRYNIRLAQKKGVTVKEMSTDEGFRLFSDLYFKTTERQKYFGHTKQYHEIIWNGMKEKYAHILIAFYENTPLAAYELFVCNNVLYYPYGGSSETHRNLMGANLLMWEAILLGKRTGATEFDMWGSLPPDYNPQDPWAGFTRFKEGYNAQFVQMVRGHDLVINPLGYTAYTYAHNVRNIYLKMRRSRFFFHKA